VRPTLLYISSEAVIPAKAGIQIASGPEGPMAQRENTGFRVKPGMTIKVKGLLTRYTSINLPPISGRDEFFLGKFGFSFEKDKYLPYSISANPMPCVLNL
jgi:hypothetical protein